MVEYNKNVSVHFSTVRQDLLCVQRGHAVIEVMPVYAMSSAGVLATQFMGDDDGIFKQTNDLRMLTLNHSNKAGEHV
jgi:hypothetical protein